MKLLVFAHTPPPHHGQSYMVGLMLKGLGGDVRSRGKSPAPIPPSGIECYHVDARFSEDIGDIGIFHSFKVLRLFRYCLQAIWWHFRYGIEAFYFVPSPGKRPALYRDWIVMALCRPFFSQIIQHWHAVGLGDWLEREATWLERWITHWLLGRPALGIALTIPSMRDALWFRSRRVEIVPNGIPDPCPDYDTALLPRRRARLAARRKLLAGAALADEDRRPDDARPEILRVLFLSLCTPEKGLFDTLEGIALANRSLREARAPWSIHGTVAGAFIRQEDEARFHARIAAADLAGVISFAGFAAGGAKSDLLRACDTLCFPTVYAAESFGLVLVEAMAAGMAVVATQWRSNSDLLPVEYPGLVPVHAPERIAASLIRTFAEDATPLRAHALEHYSERRFAEMIEIALHSLASDVAADAPPPLSDEARRAGRRQVLQIFSKYEFVGGEEGSVRRIGEALGGLHQVHSFLYSTRELRSLPALHIAGRVFRNSEVEYSLRRLLQRTRFDIWLVHNVFPAMSPVVYQVAFEQHVPVVQYLHNFRFSCANGFFLNHGELCQRCIGGNFWPAFQTKCWHESHFVSGVMGLVLRHARQMGIFERITHWIALSENQREQHIRMGIPAGRISVVPHFLTPRGPILPPAIRGHALFIGRLSPEKGVLHLLRAWKLLERRDRRLVIIGEGPEAPALQAYAAREGLTNVSFTGFLPPAGQSAPIEGAAFFVVPSIWFEPFGMVVLEAWAAGRAVIAHRIGGLPELVEDGRTGLLADPADPASLAAAMARLFDEPGLAAALGAAGRQRLESHFNRDIWLQKTGGILASL